MLVKIIHAYIWTSLANHYAGWVAQHKIARFSMPCHTSHTFDPCLLMARGFCYSKISDRHNLPFKLWRSRSLVLLILISTLAPIIFIRISWMPLKYYPDVERWDGILPPSTTTERVKFCTATVHETTCSNLYRRLNTYSHTTHIELNFH